MARADAQPAVAAGSVVFPLALAQFIASYAGSNMNVAISTIADDIGTTVIGMQTAITLFTLTMASLMIPGSKLSDIWGRKFCFMAGLAVYGSGALIAAFSQGLGLMIFGYSLLEGIGSALMIPPIYILITVLYPSTRDRAKYFGIVSGAAGLGAAAGPLIGGLDHQRDQLARLLRAAGPRRGPDHRAGPPHRRPTTRGGAAVRPGRGHPLGRRPVLRGARHPAELDVRLDRPPARTSASPARWSSRRAASPRSGCSWPSAPCSSAGSSCTSARRERAGKDPLLSPRLFRNRTSNLGLVTQNVQWLTMQGTFFVVSVFLQQIRGYNAIQTGLMLTPSTIGVLASSAAAGRLARKRSQELLIRAGFVATAVGIALLMALVREQSSIWTFVPGLLLIGLGIGVMLTSSVNVVQSAFPEQDQGDISGLSRSVSNLGSSLGTALAGSVLVGASVPGGKPFALALATMGVFVLLGLLAAVFIPTQPPAATAEAEAEQSAP